MQTEVEKIQQILTNENYVKQILAANTDDQIRKIFESNGVILNEKQVETVKKVFGNAIIAQLKKLNPEKLKNISGGKIDKEHFKEYTQIGSAYGVLIGGFVGGTIGGIHSFIETITLAENGKLNKGVIKNTIKIFGETGAAMAIGAAAGAAMGGTIGASSAVIDQSITNIMHD